MGLDQNYFRNAVLSHFGLRETHSNNLYVNFFD